MKLGLAFALLLLLAASASAQADSWEAFLGARLAGSAERTEYWANIGQQWQRVQALEKDNPVFLPGGKANVPPACLWQWKNLMQTIPAMNNLQKLRAISGFINVQLVGAPDQRNYGIGEYWAAPAEFVKNQGGDCEDFAIAKYFALRSLGFNAEDLRLLVVEVPSRRAWHALLAARINDKIFIVDNNFRPRDLALPHGQLNGFFLLRLAFNENGAWLYRYSQ